jgi:hypothetical protein
MNAQTASQMYVGIVAVTGALLAAACGGTSPTSPTGSTPVEHSFFTGVWRGTMTITVPDASPVSGPLTWTVVLVPGTNGQQFRITWDTANSWLPLQATTTTAAMETITPPTQMSTSGSYQSPRHCAGEFTTVSQVTDTLAIGQIGGLDCADPTGQRMTFSGQLVLTKQ